MREYPSMPRERKREDLLQQLRAHAVPSVLHCFADLASDLGFASDEIKALKQLGTDTRRTCPRSRPILVTSGPGIALSVRCGKPRCRSFEADRNLLFIDHLHDTRQDQGDSIISFYVRKSVYLVFFGKPSGMDNAANIGEDTDNIESWSNADLDCAGRDKARITQARTRAPKEGGAREIRSRELRSREIRSRETGSRETGLRETGSRETGSRETGSRETGSRETGSRETGLRETGSRETGLRETGSRETGSRETGSRDTGVGEIRARIVGTGEIGASGAGKGQDTGEAEL
ncbi:hypothetical protein WAI453_013095 [Rhynchosporium graminicola]